MSYRKASKNGRYGADIRDDCSIHGWKSCCQGMRAHFEYISLQIQANPGIVDASIEKLSAVAQVPAKKVW